MTNPHQIADFNDPQKAAANASKYASFDHYALHRAFYDAVEEKVRHARAQGVRPRALDLGSGTGENARILADLGCEVVAVEPAEQMRTLGATNYAHPHIQVIDDAMPMLAETCAIASSEGAFDIVLAAASFQYVEPNEALPQTLRVIGSMMVPGALLRVSYPTPPSREDQYPLPQARFQQALAEANAQLPNHRRIQIDQEVTTPASDGRRALDGEPLTFVELILRTPTRAKAVEHRAGMELI